jgi:hypothetical protein
MIQDRDSKGRFIKGNVPWNKNLDGNQSGIMFTCKFCGKPKPVEEVRIITSFFPPFPSFGLFEIGGLTRVRRESSGLSIY